MEEKIRSARETAEKLNQFLLELEYPYKIDVVNPRTIKLLDKNARYMDKITFQNLVDNIKRDHALSSLPFCWREPDGTDIVLSGNHRVQSAVHAGLPFILILYTDENLSREEQVAIQLSHNALSGKDDIVILKSLYDEIEQIELKQYAALDSETMGELDKLEFISVSEPRPHYEQVIIQFLPEDADSLKSIINDATNIFSLDHNFIASIEHYEKTFELLADIKEKYNIVSNPVALAKIIELARERLDTFNYEEDIILGDKIAPENNEKP